MIYSTQTCKFYHAVWIIFTFKTQTNYVSFAIIMWINVDSKSISKIYNVIQLSMTLINISNRLMRVKAITQPKCALNLHEKS